MRPPCLRVRRRTWIAACILPLGLAMLGAFLIAHQPAALAAPIFGPWGGWLLGHGECTFSAVAPRASYSLLALGLAGFVGRLRVADESVRQGLAALLVFWSWLWLAAGLLSVANTAS